MAAVAVPSAPLPPSPTSVPSVATSGGEIKTYIDPEADVVLYSSDGRAFRVHSYFLLAHSTYLRAHRDEHEFHLPFKSSVIKLYLDLMHLKTMPPSLVHTLHAPLFALCDHFGSPGVAERALFAMHEAVTRNPWNLFEIASQRHNLPLARSALKSMHDPRKKDAPRIKDITCLTPEQAKGVSLPYLLGLYKAAIYLAEAKGNKHVEPVEEVHPANGTNGHAHTAAGTHIGNGVAPAGTHIGNGIITKATDGHANGSATHEQAHTHSHAHEHHKHAHPHSHIVEHDDHPELDWKIIAEKFQPVE